MSQYTGHWGPLGFVAVLALALSLGGSDRITATGSVQKPASCMETCMQRVFTEPYSRVGQTPPPMLCRDPYEQHCAAKCAVSTVAARIEVGR